MATNPNILMCEAGPSLIPTQVGSGTEVGGIITENTIWSEEEYLVTASILVPEGVTLEITPGVSINFQNFFIQIDGTFRVRGVPENKISINFTRTGESSILFTDSSIDYDPVTEEGCIIENAIITSHGSTILIEISYCSPKISSNSLTNYSPMIGIVILVYSPGVIITNNQIKHGGYGLIVGSSGDNIRCPIIAYNTIQNNGVGIITRGGISIIKNNLIIECGLKSPFEDSGGITVRGSSIITNNVIKNNSAGLSVSNGASIYYNNIYDNEGYNARLSEEIVEDVNVTHNWWGSIEEEDIELKMYDYQDFFRLSNLLYVPFLEEPINETSVGVQPIEPEIESEPEPEPSKPAEFVVSYLEIEPRRIELGGTVTISVNATNVGETPGSYNVTLNIEDPLITSVKEVALQGGESEIVEFEFVPEAEGTYFVDIEGMIGHIYVVTPIPVPPYLSNLTITPAEIELGYTVTLRFDIENIDSQAFVYTVATQVGNLTGSIDIELEAYESKTVSRVITHGITIPSDSVGIIHVQVGGLTGSFEVKTPPLKPAELVFSNLEITPKEVELGMSVTVSVDVTNVGEEMGGCTVELKVNGHVVESVEIPPFGGVYPDFDQVTATQFFELTRSEGTYEVEVDGLTGSFTIIKPEPSFWDKIPGFPYESIIIGLIAVIIIIWRARKF